MTMSNTTEYRCINNFKHVFSKGAIYAGYPDKQIPTGITFTDDSGTEHTITARLFTTLFEEVK